MSNINKQLIKQYPFKSNYLDLNGLKAILVTRASEDDVHNFDGSLHIDLFTQKVETENLMPAWLNNMAVSVNDKLIYQMIDFTLRMESIR